MLENRESWMETIEPKDVYSTFWNDLKKNKPPFSNPKSFYGTACRDLRRWQTNNTDDLEMYSTPQIKAPWKASNKVIYKSLENWNRYIQFYKHFKHQNIHLLQASCLQQVHLQDNLSSAVLRKNCFRFPHISHFPKCSSTGSENCSIVAIQGLACWEGTTVHTNGSKRAPGDCMIL